jgi:C1A family cysteine protease
MYVTLLYRFRISFFSFSREFVVSEVFLSQDLILDSFFASFLHLSLKKMIYQLVVALSLAASVSATYSQADPTHLKYLWDSFKRDFNREYATADEDNTRFGHFVNNLKAADARNKQERSIGGNAMHGITKFSDLSQAEFEAYFLTAQSDNTPSEAILDTTERTVDTTASLVDWSGKLTTPVKDQGYCGSCWAFSAVEQIESDAMRTLKYSQMLSPEQVVDCDTTSQGCNGGWTEHAYKYVTKAGGIETEKDYPYSAYQGKAGSCKATKSKYAIAVSSYNTIKGESSMASYVQKTGPLSVCVDASTWNSYNGGIMKSCGKKVNHCVQAVGVDASSSGYWKVRNSWGTKWGESGFIRLAYGQDMCAITNDPTYAVVKKL